MDPALDREISCRPPGAEPCSSVDEVSVDDADWDAADPASVRSMLGRALGSGCSRSTCWSWRPRGWSTVPRTRASVRRAAPSARSSTAQRRLRQRLAPRPPPVPREGLRPRDAQADRCRCRRLNDDVREVAPAHARRDLRAGRGLLQGPGRVDAPAVARGRRDGHERDRRRRRAAGGRGSPVNQQRSGTDAVTVTYFGDGAVNIGSVLETFNLAAAWELPVCFFIENNRYAVSTPVVEANGRAAVLRPGARLQHPELAGRRHGPAGRAHGDDRGRWSTCAPAAARRSSRRTSTASSTRTARYPGSAFGYRDKDEETGLAGRDPLDVAAPARPATRPRAPRTSSPTRSREVTEE